MMRLRKSEWVLITFLGYVVVISPFFADRPYLGYHSVFILAAVAVLLALLAFGQQGESAEHVSMIRDWLPLLLTFIAFREMGLFAPAHYPRRFEPIWNRWDLIILNHWHFRAAIDSLGGVIPFYLELCYFFVYGIGSYCVAALYLRGKRREVDSFFLVYLTGTLLAYALFPYFPSLPPRFAFAGFDASIPSTWLRRLNLLLLNNGSIQTGVFPSAHVSSAFSCSWAMFILLGRKSKVPWLLLAYALSVSLATIYGRYHYAADVVSGFAVSLVAAAAGKFLNNRDASAQSSSLEPCQSVVRLP
jgi:membrane-associated phospholipid phosphatase